MQAARRHFASDNNAPVHPRVWEAMRAADAGHARAYGDDAWTRGMEERFREHFGPAARAWPVFLGTGANVTGLQAMLARHEAVICAQHAHIAVDECGAPERHLGAKLILVATPDGKLRPSDIEPRLHGLRDQHHVQPKVVSITQSTEYGTVYAPEEIRALSACCRAHGLLLHLDGARLANAAASLGVPLRALATDAGVDVLSFGGTKNGAMLAEAVVFLKEGLGEDFRFVRKQSMQLASKMRYVSAQLAALLDGDLWLANARHANAMARALRARAERIEGLSFAWPTQANGVFPILPKDWIAPLQAESFFYVWDEERGVCRWMCSWDTTEEDIERFAAALEKVALGRRA
jgi:threonine aldolase